METSPPFRFLLLSCLLSPLSTFASLDLNQNGQSDVWENAFQATGLAAEEDSDGDGMTNLQESIAGTDPFDPRSRLLPAIGGQSGNEFSLFSTEAMEKEYTLWSSPDLSPDSWTIQEQWIGRGDPMEIRLSLPDSSPVFVRLEVMDVDSDGDGLSDWEEHQLGYDPDTANSMRLPTHDYTRAADSVGSVNQVSISAVDSTTHEGWPDPAVFAIRRTGGVDALSIHLSVTGTASIGSDFQTIQPVVEIPFGSNTVWVEIVPLEDDLTESDETVTLTLLEGTHYTASEQDAASITIIDDSGSISAKEAARFLTQATFGPTPELIQQVQTLGIEGWIDDQFNQPIGLHQPILEAIDWTAEGGGPYAFHKMRAWWEQAMNAPDPLRQRMGFALSEIMVISDSGAPERTPRGMLNYYEQTRIGNVLSKLKELGLDKNTLVVYTVDNGAWQDVYPDAGYTPFRSTKGTLREGGNRVPAIALWPGKVPSGVRNHEIIGGTDLMATFASLAGQRLPKVDREGKPIIFDSYDMTPVLMGTGESPRDEWFYFTENELSPGASRVGHLKAVYNIRGDDGAVTGGLAVDTNLGWKGPEKYVATAPQIFDLLQDPQERYDLFMTNWTERTWALVSFSEATQKLMKTYVEYPPRPIQSETYTGPVTLSNYFKFQHIRESLEKDGVSLPMPTGN